MITLTPELNEKKLKERIKTIKRNLSWLNPNNKRHLNDYNNLSSDLTYCNEQLKKLQQNK